MINLLLGGDPIVGPDGRPTLAFNAKWQNIVRPSLGTVEQATSRTTGVTCNGLAGQITLVSAAGTTSWQSFTVTNDAVATGFNVHVSQVSGTDLYLCHVTAIADGSFRITFATTAGTTTEQPVFRFTVEPGA